ncbi:Venom serine protease 34 [Orchesella cincta]|uniref:Venom serine protease 34 n=1 Tax=Orchesella cincta TaxID=48709 RepID=A0A1D2M6P6_ORCCI|nr:Venom serine protease 34 [Orchesella cincta]
MRFPWEFATVLLVVLGAAPRASANCKVSECGQLSGSANPCPRNFEEISRESCSSWGGSGEMAYCCPTNSTEGLLATTYGAELNEFPHMALLSFDGEDWCGGTIYNKRYILTAAHCLVSKGIVGKANEYTIKVGRNIGQIKMMNNDYQIEQIIVHPKYSYLLQNRQDGIYYDIALLKLARDIEFGDTVKSLEIAPEGFNEIANGDNVVIVGWGTTHTFKGSDHLQKTNLAIRTDETCFGDGKMGGNLDVNQTTISTSLRWRTLGRHLPSHSRGEEIQEDLRFVGALTDTQYSAVLHHSEETTRCYNYGVACRLVSYAEVDYFRDWIQGHAGKQDPRTFYKVKLYGEPAPASRAVHQVHIKSDGGKPCGGTLIAPDTVVTAASVWHLVTDKLKRTLESKSSQVENLFE